MSALKTVRPGWTAQFIGFRLVFLPNRRIIKVASVFNQLNFQKNYTSPNDSPPLGEYLVSALSSGAAAGGGETSPLIKISLAVIRRP